MIEWNEVEEIFAGMGIHYEKRIHTENPAKHNYVVFTDKEMKQPCLYMACAYMESIHFLVYVYLYRGDGNFGGLLQIFSDPFDLQHWLINEFDTYAN